MERHDVPEVPDRRTATGRRPGCACSWPNHRRAGAARTMPRKYGSGVVRWGLERSHVRSIREDELPRRGDGPCASTLGSPIECHRRRGASLAATARQPVVHVAKPRRACPDPADLPAADRRGDRPRPAVLRVRRDRQRQQGRGDLRRPEPPVRHRGIVRRPPERRLARPERGGQSPRRRRGAADAGRGVPQGSGPGRPGRLRRRRHLPRHGQLQLSADHPDPRQPAERRLDAVVPIRGDRPEPGRRPEARDQCPQDGLEPDHEGVGANPDARSEDGQARSARVLGRRHGQVSDRDPELRSDAGDRADACRTSRMGHPAAC